MQSGGGGDGGRRGAKEDFPEETMFHLKFEVEGSVYYPWLQTTEAP